jgi:SAM-dependent methyltransferase
MTLDRNLTADIAADWRQSPYYAAAEQDQWLDMFWVPSSPFRGLFDTLDRHHLVELACGHGRHTARLIQDGLDRSCEAITLIDVNAENVEFCRERFHHFPLVSVLKNDGSDFAPLPDGAATGIFCYDAMVHFEYDAVMSYLKDAFRVLAPGSRALFHHSNNDKAPGTHYLTARHCRNFMSKNLFAHVAMRAGLTVIEQMVMDWGHSDKDLDCLSLVEKPAT